LIVASSDNVGVTGITLTFDGQVVAIDTAGRATVLANRAGFIPGVATVVDAAGNVGKAPITVTVIDRSDAEAPIATITAPADDAGGHTSTDERLVSFAGGLKLGNFTLSFTDLSIPVSGIPITVGRTYDTLTAANPDDFGYGWRLEFGDTDLRTSVGKTGDEAD